MTRRYLVIYEWAGKNYSGYAPDVPGCVATAKTLPKMRSVLKGALEAHLQWMKDDGEAIPVASAKVTVDLKDYPEYPNPPGYYVVVERLELAMPIKQTSKSKVRKSTRELVGAF